MRRGFVSHSVRALTRGVSINYKTITGIEKSRYHGPAARESGNVPIEPATTLLLEPKIQDKWLAQPQQLGASDDQVKFSTFSIRPARRFGRHLRMSTFLSPAPSKDPVGSQPNVATDSESPSLPEYKDTIHEDLSSSDSQAARSLVVTIARFRSMHTYRGQMCLCCAWCHGQRLGEPRTFVAQ